MANTRKNKPQEKEQTENQVLLSKREVWDVLNFARNLTEGLYGGVYNPDLVSARMKEISFTPIEATEETLREALKHPKESEAELRSFIENMEMVSAPLKRIFTYLSSQLAFDFTYVSTNAKKEDYSKTQYQKEERILWDFTDKFDYKRSFRNVIKQLLRNEYGVFALRDVGDSYVLQELPIQYTKITGKWAGGYLAAFNFYFFMLPGVDIRLYPKFFQEKFNEIFQGSDASKNQYIPSRNVEQRGNSQFVYWVDLPPEVGWVFKFDESITTAIPPFTALLPELIQQSAMRQLQMNANIAKASKILVAEVPLLNDNAKTSVKDMVALSPDLLAKFLALIKTGLGEVIKVAAAPLQEFEGVQFDGDSEMYDTFLRTMVASSGLNTALFYSSKLKANAMETQLSAESDHLWIADAMYPQFSFFMTYFVNKLTSKYGFEIIFEGNDYYLDRQRRFEYANSLADKGIVLPQKIAASIGMKPQNLYRMMEESNGKKFVDGLTPIVSAFQIGKDEGRPKKSQSKLSNEGVETQTDGANEARE